MKYNTETRQVQCEKRLLKYKLTRKPVKNINLRIKADGRILVSANYKVPADYIDGFIKKKQYYIIRALDRYEEKRKQSQVYPRKHVSGESYEILGKSLRLKVIQGKDESVTWNDRFIYLTVKDKENFKHKERLINKWLKDLQTETFDQICRETYIIFKKYDFVYPDIKIRDMKTRWGSCRPHKSSITLNSKLIKMPRKCIEYVVLHEFAHFIHPNHSKEFYDFIEMLMPDWKERKQEIKKYETR